MILAISSESKQKYFSEKQKGGVVYKITNREKTWKHIKI